MKNKKSILKFSGILIALLCLTACGQSNTSSVSQSQTETTTSSNGEVTVSTSQSSTSETTDNADSDTQESPIKQKKQATKKLAAGEYCYKAKTGTLDASAQIKVDTTNKVDGTIQATIQNSKEGYFSSYTQTFTGELVADKAQLKILTNIEDDTQNKEETWTITESSLKTGRETFAKADCAKLTRSESNQEKAATPNAKPVRVKFNQGASSKDIKDSVVRGERRTYLLGAKQGQQMSIKINSLEKNAVFDVIASDGEIIEQEATTWDGELPDSGDYQIVVGGTRGNTSYDLTVEIK